MHHPQVVKSPISNDCLKINIDGHTERQLVPKTLLQVSVRELYNSLISDPVYGGLKEARDAESNIIICDSTLCSLFPPQLKYISSVYKVMCGCESFISSKIVHLSLLSWRNRSFKKSRINSKCSKQKVWGKIKLRI